jgi:hypothetical protein
MLYVALGLLIFPVAVLVRGRLREAIREQERDERFRHETDSLG